MIFYNKKNFEKQIEKDYKDLEKYKNSYNKRISLYNMYLDTMKLFEKDIVGENKCKKEELENKIKIFKNQINKIDNNMNFINELLKIIDANGKINIDKKALNKYNRKNNEISNNYIKNSLYEEQITIDYINELMSDLTKTLIKTKEENKMEKILNEKILNEKINCKEENISKDSNVKNNNTLLISEKLGKIILPYKAEEVIQIFNSANNKYASIEEVIEDKFTREFSDFRIQFSSRYNETMKLTRERENFKRSDAILLAIEMMKKRYLHPAIIAACKNLNELDVYLDCLDKNELEEFKIFKIKYELYPMITKHNKVPKGTRYKDEHKLNIWENIKNMFKSNKDKNFLPIR